VMQLSGCADGAAAAIEVQAVPEMESA